MNWAVGLIASITSICSSTVLHGWRAGKLSFKQFRDIYDELSDEHSVTSVFQEYSSDAAKMLMAPKDLVTFYKKHQGGQVLSLDQAKDVIYRYGYKGKFRVTDFVHFLHGNENEVWNKIRKTTIYEDMTLPLTEYFMNSSHNTYVHYDSSL